MTKGAPSRVFFWTCLPRAAHTAKIEIFWGAVG